MHGFEVRSIAWFLFRSCLGSSVAGFVLVKIFLICQAICFIVHMAIKNIRLNEATKWGLKFLCLSFLNIISLYVKFDWFIFDFTFFSFLFSFLFFI